MRWLCALALAVLSLPALGQNIDDLTVSVEDEEALFMGGLPDGAKVQMEVDARKDDLLGMVQGFLATMGPQAAKDLAMKNGPAAQQLLLSLPKILDKVQRMRMVVYAVPAGFDFVAFHERSMLGRDGTRMLYVAGPQPMSVIRFTQPDGIGLIAGGNGGVIVARTDGLPDLPALGRLMGSFAAASMAAKPAQAVPAKPSAPAKAAKPKVAPKRP